MLCYATLFSVFGVVVKHGLSYLTYYFSSRYILPVDCATSALSLPASLDEWQDPCKLVPIFLDCGF